ncbi:hypothetical protein JAAARDRAFT_43696 [Jaapia argillacea MUCL 33604]|uniref:AAA+ ATPase domain-containing protein n=1 Tax=Jaapia argillacea MUCL 33604 TaxID=933084 RepID=A0A067QMM0_9AGAM|nr:hypothetical protein JAAARDRAFT_43696 [Jaapia argillacea MUCL 33604]
MWPVHIEVRVSQSATARFDTIRNLVHSYLTSSLSRIFLPSTLSGWETNSVLASSIEQIIASESNSPSLALSPSLPIEQCALQIHVYQPSGSDAFEEYSSGRGSEGEEVMAASVCELPSRDWEGLWDSLVFPDDIKLKLLDYIYATVVFSDADVDFNVVSWNRVVLLHGPPGTGKTSLCRALAQKLSIRLSHRYPHTRLLEINSHSLFSRWFSESGKLVQKLFASVMEMVDDEETFVVVLIDEVESLTAARAGAMAGTEPSDALRVVNALLTQLDKLKHRKNVLVMSTSNLAKAIDSAFVDRADIIQYIDLPPPEAVYQILRSCLVELVNKGIVRPIDVPSLREAEVNRQHSASLPPLEAKLDRLESTTLLGETKFDVSSASIEVDQVSAQVKLELQRKARCAEVGQRLLRLAERCRDQGMSGRSLRRLPVLAHARYIGIGIGFTSPNPSTHHHHGVNGVTSGNGGGGRKKGKGGALPGTEVEIWLDAMDKVVENHGVERGKFES